MFLVTWISALVLSLCLCTQSLMASWSTPEVIYPTSAPYNATEAFIATDAGGNCVAVWFDATGSGSMQAARLASGAVNGSGQPLWVLTNPIFTSNVQDPVDFRAQAVGVDGSGNAIAVWSDGILVYAATLPFDGSTWSSPTTISTQIRAELVGSACIAVAANGNAVVSWFSAIHPYDGVVVANVFKSGAWQGQTVLLSGAVEYNEGANQVAIDPVGNAVVAMAATSGRYQAVSYDVTNNTWTSILSVSTAEIASASDSMDPNGNAVLVWTQNNLSVYAATLLLNTHTLTHVTQLSSNANINNSAPCVVSDASGNAIAVWMDASGNLASARYSFSSGTWTLLPYLDLSGNTAANLSLSGDASGNVVASWTVYLSTTSYIQSAVLHANGTLWELVDQVSSSSDSDQNAHIVLTTAGNAVLIWENDINAGTTGTIDSSNFLNILSGGTLPPSFFTGKVTQNKFLVQTDRIHKLNWGASPDSTTVAYQLYRDMNLIATLSADTFSYEDHNRSSQASNTYALSSENADGYVSTSLFVNLQ